jgi:hypothetical protein
MTVGFGEGWMARHAEDREDLFAEVSALTTRIELTFPEEAEIVVAGCRANGAWSIYFGGDPCYHFDATGGLRRGFVDGGLYRTQGETLARLIRVRTEAAVELHRTDLRSEECVVFLERMRVRLEELQQLLRSEAAFCRRRFPTDCDVTSMLAGALSQILSEGLRLAPAIPTRRSQC